MAECAERAGFEFSGNTLENTTDGQAEYVLDYDPEYRDDGSAELDWFSRWCSHGFRGMVGWLKKQTE
jgi:hypothetical protein